MDDSFIVVANVCFMTLRRN